MSVVNAIIRRHLASANEHGVPYARIAERIGVSRQAVSQFAGGKATLAFPHVEHIARLLGYRIEVRRQPQDIHLDCGSAGSTETTIHYGELRPPDRPRGPRRHKTAKPLENGGFMAL
jgi:transcriptional regulator with XRE-family HTH domain